MVSMYKVINGMYVLSLFSFYILDPGCIPCTFEALYMRAYIYNVSSFFPSSLTLKKDALQPLSQSAGYGKVSYFLQKSFLYILAVSIKALLLHPLSGTRAAMV